jgi:membrane protein insertase Oxa1/YidC/SpoIIIJ
MLQAICESTPDAPTLTDVNVMQPLGIIGLAIIAVILMFVFFWLTGT